MSANAIKYMSSKIIFFNHKIKSSEQHYRILLIINWRFFCGIFNLIYISTYQGPRYQKYHISHTRLNNYQVFFPPYRLEALASPQLVLAFNTNDKEKSKFFDQIFSDMNRSPQLLKYYRKCVRARALKAWSNIVEDNEQFTLLEWSKSYFSYLRQQVEIQVIIRYFILGKNIIYKYLQY